MLERFCGEYEGALAQADAMAVWFYQGEERICRECCPSARLLMPEGLEPYYHQEPWTQVLAGRKILVIHPFRQSIVSQYAGKRELLFSDPRVLPRFDLTVIEAVQSIAATPTRHANWFDALDAMTQEMERTDFDVALIGAGAYGLPLAARAKRMGRKAMHLGGATQVLFGIKGRRWDRNEVVRGFYNPHWVRPSAAETPARSRDVEGGCYW